MRSLRVLIVEDELLIALDLNDILMDAGHVVIGIASSLREALSVAEANQPFDLAILDIDITGEANGIETAERLRADHGMEALFVSASIEERERALALDWGPIGFISKPYLPREVLQAIAGVSAS